MKIIKRDGRIQEYSWPKVEAVVYKAFNSIKQEVPDKFLDQLKQAVESAIKSRDSFTVEEMQDLIQKELIKRNKYEVVESFILYRNKRNEIREQKSDLIKQIQSKLAGTLIENQNANVDEASFGGRIGEAGRVV
jgi:anaerobic ribonucleoside-triphosphate reductase